MLVTSSQSSSQRPLGLSVEEIYALDRQYRRLDQQQQQQTTTTHMPSGAPSSSSRLAGSSNLNRYTSRSLDLVSAPSPSAPLTTLPSLEIHGHGYHARPQTPATSAVLSNYTRSNSIDQLRYPPAVLPNHIFPSTMRTAPRPTYENPRYRNYLQQHPSSMASPPAPPPPPHATNYTNHYLGYNPEPYDARASCKLRRQQPLKRESSRRILVRPVIQRRREPSISSSCESLDEARSAGPSIPPPPSSSAVTFTPSASLINHVIEPLETEQRLLRSASNQDSLSDDSDVNLYEMRVPIGKTYDTSDISVQLEGPKILIHCHTIEPTDKRGNYRKHEFKTELLVPDVVDDETIVSYLTEDGQLIVEGKYHAWAWREIKQKRKLEQQQQEEFQSGVPSGPTTTLPNEGESSSRNDSGFDQERRSSIVGMNHLQRSPAHIEKLDNNRTVIHVGQNSPSFLTDTKSVSDIINRFNTLTSTIWDGQYSFTSDYPPVLLYHVRLPLDASMDTIRIQADPQAQLLKVFSDEQTFGSSSSTTRLHIRSIPRICRLPRDYIYDYAHLRVIFLRDNFIRIEVPTFH